MKIFVIGFNKTGTSSIHYLFKSLHIHSVHTTQPVLEIIKKYDAFTDGHHNFFEKYYEKYPDSLFILNTRPIHNWLVSRYKHAAGRNFVNSNWCWPISDTKTNSWISERERHYQKIFHFFADKPKQLLIVNIEKKGYENEIIKFTGYMPRNIVCKQNVRASSKIKYINEIETNVCKCLKQLNYTGSEILLKPDIPVHINMFTTFL